MNILQGSIVRALQGYGDLTKGEKYVVSKDQYEENNQMYLGIMINGYERIYKRERFEVVKCITDMEKDVALNKSIELTSKWRKQDHDIEIRRINDRLDSVKYNIEEYKSRLQKAFHNERMFMAEIDALIKAMNETTDFSSDLKAILEHGLVTNITVVDKSLLIYTDNIIIQDNEGNKFLGNKYKLIFDYDRMECKIYGLDESLCRTSWWADRYDNEHKDPHPHVNGKTNEACWGSAGDMLTFNMNSYELYASFIVVLNFLQQVNLSDSAGKFIRNWDCIDEDGEEIDNPYACERECHMCDSELTDDNEDWSECDICGRPTCDHCSTWVDDRDAYVCDNCYDEHYSSCDRCDTITHDSNMNACYECGDDICDECTTTIDGNTYCQSCYEDNFRYCGGCADDVPRETTFRCDQCGETYCSECDTRQRHEGRTLCQECCEEAIEDDEEDEDNE